MAEPTTPPPPPGFDTVVGAGATPPPPPGFDTVVGATQPPAQQSNPNGPVDAQGNPFTVPSLPQQLSNAGNQIAGFIKGAGQTTAGAINVLNNRITARNDPGDVQALSHFADWVSSHSKINNAEQSKGEMTQSALELAAMGLVGGAEGAVVKGVEELPAASELVGQVGKNLKLLESNSTLALVLRVGLDTIKGGARGAVEQGIQTGVKTGDPVQAGHAARVGAVFGAGGGAVASGANEVAGAIDAARPVGRDIAGADFPTNSRTGGVILRPVKEAGPEAATQAVDEAVGNMGKTAVANSLNRANRARPLETLPRTQRIPPKLPAPEGSTPGIPMRTALPIEIQRPIDPNDLSKGYETVNMGSEAEPTPVVEGKTAFEPGKQQIATRSVAGKGSPTSPTEPYNATVDKGRLASSFAYGDEEPLPQVSDLGNQPQGSHREPIYQYRTQVKPGSPEPGVDVAKGPGALILTNDGQASSIGKARANLAQYNRVLNDDGIVGEMGVRQHQQLQAQRDDLADQISRYDNAAATHAARAQTEMTDYYASQPHFDTHDVIGAVRNTDSLGQGGQLLKDSAAPFWDRADAASGGRFSELREDEKSLEKRFNSDPTANLASIRQQLATNRQAMMDWFDEHRAEFSPKEWETHRDLYQDGIVTSNLNTLVQSRFNGINRAEVAQPLEHKGSTLKRIFQPGNDFNQEIENFYNEGNNREVLERTIGRAHMNDIKNIGQLFEGAQREQATATLMDQIRTAYRHHRYVGGGLVGGGIGGSLGYGLGHGAGTIAAGTAVGSTAGAVVAGTTTGFLRYLGDRLASEPDFLKPFAYAIKNNVSPRFAAPLLIARMLAGTRNAVDRQPPTQQDKEVVPADKERGVQSVTLPTMQPGGQQ
jgi:hypothetical protein